MDEKIVLIFACVLLVTVMIFRHPKNVSRETCAGKDDPVTSPPEPDELRSSGATYMIYNQPPFAANPIFGMAAPTRGALPVAREKEVSYGE